MTLEEFVKTTTLPYIPLRKTKLTILYVEPIYIYIARVCMGFRAYIAQRGKRSGWRVSEL